MDKSSEYVNEQQCALQGDLNELAMYQNLCHDVVTHDKPLKSNDKSETQTMNSPFGKQSDFEFNVSLIEETIPSQSNVWKHWTGNGNSGMNAVAQANDIYKTQLSKNLED